MMFDDFSNELDDEVIIDDDVFESVVVEQIDPSTKQLIETFNDYDSRTDYC